MLKRDKFITNTHYKQKGGTMKNTTKINQKDQRLIDTKVSLLQLAEELSNIQKDCKVAQLLWI